MPKPENNNPAGLDSSIQSPDQSLKTPERRTFLAGLNVGAASLAALAATGVAMGQSRPSAEWTPTFHEQDDWMSDNQAMHRFLMDTTSEAGFSDAVLYAGNFMLANRTGYGLENSDSAVIVVARHISTYFGYNNAMWEKYGEAWFAGEEEPRKANPHLARLEGLADQGVMFAICSFATTRLASMAARATGAEQDAVFEELVANRIRNAHMVPAGILAVNRAQERGYAMVSV